jgi:deoxyribodipyrimidine photo-lyase
LNNNPENLEEYPEPAPNPDTIRQHPVYGKLIQDEQWNVPDEVEGFQCRDRELMDKLWPVGTDKALQVSILANWLDTRLIALYRF